LAPPTWPVASPRSPLSREHSGSVLSARYRLGIRNRIVQKSRQISLLAAVLMTERLSNRLHPSRVSTRLSRLSLCDPVTQFVAPGISAVIL